MIRINLISEVRVETFVIEAGAERVAAKNIKAFVEEDSIARNDKVFAACLWSDCTKDFTLTAHNAHVEYTISGSDGVYDLMLKTYEVTND